MVRGQIDAGRKRDDPRVLTPSCSAFSQKVIGKSTFATNQPGTDELEDFTRITWVLGVRRPSRIKCLVLKGEPIPYAEVIGIWHEEHSNIITCDGDLCVAC